MGQVYSLFESLVREKRQQKSSVKLRVGLHKRTGMHQSPECRNGEIGDGRLASSAELVCKHTSSSELGV